MSDHAIRSLQIRSPLNRAIYQAIRDFRMGNMCDEDGYPWPLVDLMSNPAPCDISTGEEQMVSLADEVCEAVEAISLWQPIETAPNIGEVLLFVEETGEQFVAFLGTNPEDGDKQWVFARGSGISFIVRNPTHWMPLPSAPSQIEEG